MLLAIVGRAVIVALGLRATMLTLALHIGSRSRSATVLLAIVGSAIRFLFVPCATISAPALHIPNGRGTDTILPAMVSSASIFEALVLGGILVGDGQRGAPICDD
jgi:hypothetical protein